MKSRMKRILAVLAKLITTMVVIWLIAGQVSIDGLAIVLDRISWSYVVLAVSVFFLGQLISAYRFKVIACRISSEITMWPSINAHFLGLLFNQVLPSGVGGDVLKAAYLKSRLGFWTAIRVAIYDRASGLLVLLTTGIALTSQYDTHFSDSPIMGVIVLIGLTSLLVIAMTAIVLSWGRALRFLSGLSETLGIVLNDLNIIVRGPSFAEQLFLSGIIHAVGISTYWLLGISVGLDLTMMEYLLIVPLIFLVSLLPISFAGWGVRELSAITLFAHSGVLAEDALAVSIMFGLVFICVSLPGVPIFLRSGAITTSSKEELSESGEINVK